LQSVPVAAPGHWKRQLGLKKKENPMRSRLLFLLAGAVTMLVAGAASAGTLDSATWVQTAQGFPMTRTAADTRWSYSGTSTSTAISANVNYFFTSTVFGVPKTPNGTLDLVIKVTQGGTQAITATSLGAAGSPGIGGVVLVGGGLPVHVGMNVNQSMFMLGTQTIVNVPLSAGKGVLITGTFNAVAVNHTITVQFYSWTVGTAMFANLTSKGASLPNVTASGSFNLTSNGAGMVTLVSPSIVDIDGPLAQRRTAAFTSIVLNFVPEPGTLLLLGAGALGLVLMGSRKR
jgi:hypothetical protein